MALRAFGIATGAFVEERDDWAAAVGRAAREGWSAIELTAITEERFEALEPFLRERVDALAAFERVSIHAPPSFVHLQRPTSSQSCS